MIASSAPLQRALDAKLLVVDAHGGIRHAPRAALAQLLRASDLVVANDAATLPASLHGQHVPSGSRIEVRLAGRRSLNPNDVHCFSAVVFGEGDFHTRTEDRPPPPLIAPDDRLTLGPLCAIVERVLGPNARRVSEAGAARSHIGSTRGIGIRSAQIFRTER